MKKLFVIASTIVLLLIGNGFIQTADSAYAEEVKKECNCHEHHFISKEEVKRLVKQGFSKKEIYTAAHIAKFADKNIDDVLKTYKDNNSSWEKTTEQYGINLEKLKKNYAQKKEQYLNENKETVIENIAEYSGKTEEEIESWANNGISLRFLIGAATLAKASNKDITDIVQLKVDGQSYSDIRKNLNPDRNQLHAEMKILTKKIKDDIVD